MEIVDVIKYFAKFPDKNGVLKNFKRSSESVSGYSELKSYIENLPDAIMPEITELIVSTDEKEVSDRIRNINGYFLFIEYGQLQGEYPDRMRLRPVTFNLAVYLCYHDNKQNRDSMEEALIMDNCLQKMFAISKQMISDDNLICPNKRFAESILNFSPVEPAFMYQSIGWGLTFKKSNKLEL